MPDAGAPEHRPVLRGDAALLAHRECHHQATVVAVGHGGKQALAHDGADPVHLLHRAAAAIGDTDRRLAHIACGADAAFEQPGLVVEAARIDEAMRAAQATPKVQRSPGCGIAASAPSSPLRARQLSSTRRGTPSWPASGSKTKRQP